jgi:HEAT repeat protein
MLFKPCPSCRKTIPFTIAVCPYCHKDEKGRDIAAQESVSVELDPQTRTDVEHLGSDDPVLRRTAADRLLQRGPAVVPFLIALVQEHTHKALPEAIRVLGRLRDPRAAGALTQALKIGQEEVHTAAVWALSRLNDPQAVGELLQTTERNNPTVQAYLGHALAEVQDARVRPALVRLARHANHEVAFQALWALGELGDIAAIPFLRRQLGRKDPVVRAAAEAALRRLGGPVRRVIPAGAYAGGAMVLAALAAWGWMIYR